jgi:hypothetical protein
VELYAEEGDREFERAALKYLARYLAEANPTLADVAAVDRGWTSSASATGSRLLRRR